MTVHSSGSGSSWNESVDIDQPHGLDYLEMQDIRIGTRLRMAQEHSTFADSTAGGIHKPGGSAILAMDITNAVGDPTGNVVADGTFRGHGLAWTYVVEAGANKGLLWCATAAAGLSTTGDWTLVKLHPDLQWAGGDITWQGAHEFDGSVDFTGPINVDGSADFSDVFAAGDISLAGDFMMDGSFLPTTCATDFGGFLDEDDLASDATAAVASQQSVKAYVDTKVHGYVMLQDIQASGVAGQTIATTGTWTKVRISTETIDTGNNCSLAANVITLDAGTYECNIAVPGLSLGAHRIKLQDTTGAATLVLGNNCSSQSGDASGGNSILMGRFTIGVQSALEIQVTNAAAGPLGSAVSDAGESECYAVAVFRKIN